MYMIKSLSVIQVILTCDTWQTAFIVQGNVRIAKGATTMLMSLFVTEMTFILHAFTITFDAFFSFTPLE
jgi:hypothetical protein